MKRTILIIVGIVLSVCMMTGCGKEKFSQKPISPERAIAEPLSPEESEEILREIIPTKQTFDRKRFPLRETLPDLQEILGEHPATFVFNEDDWTLTQETEHGKRYTNEEGTMLIINTEEIIISNCSFEENFPEAFTIRYDTKGKLKSFDSYYYRYDKGSNSTTIGRFTETEKYHYDVADDGGFLETWFIATDPAAGGKIIRSFSDGYPINNRYDSRYEYIQEYENYTESFIGRYSENGSLSGAFYVYQSEDRELEHIFNRKLEYTGSHSSDSF